MLRSALLAGVALWFLPAAAASASHTQGVFFEAPRQLLEPSTRPAAIATLQHLGVGALRIEILSD